MGETLRKREVLWRMVLSFLANMVVPAFLYLLLPIVLMDSESELDFVKDAVAIAFIPMLDDLPVERETTLWKKGGHKRNDDNNVHRKAQMLDASASDRDFMNMERGKSIVALGQSLAIDVHSSALKSQYTHLELATAIHQESSM